MNAFPVIAAHGFVNRRSRSPLHANLESIRQWLNRLIPNRAELCALKNESIYNQSNKNNHYSPQKIYLTIDDALVSILDFASEFSVKGTIFVVTDYVGKLNNWPSQPSWVPRESCLNWSELRELSEAGWTIAAHSHTHPDFHRLSHDKIKAEIETSVQIIEDNTGSKCNLFAYPYGNAPRRAREIIQEMGLIGFGTEPGWVDDKSDLAFLPRIDLYDILRSDRSSNWAMNKPCQAEIQLLRCRRHVGAWLNSINISLFNK